MIGTATGAKAANLLRNLGITEVIDLRGKNSVEAIRGLAPEGLDAVLALAGGPTLERLLDLVRPGGRVAYRMASSLSHLAGPKIRIVAFDAEASPKHSARLERAVEEARLQVPIAAVYPLAQAAKAHERLEKGRVLGRIVLQIRREKS